MKNLSPVLKAPNRIKARAGTRSGPRDSMAPCAENEQEAAKSLFQLSRDVILSLDRAGNILCINQRGIELSGYSETELRGANIRDRLIFPEDRQAMCAILADLSRGKARQYEARWI